MKEDRFLLHLNFEKLIGCKFQRISKIRVKVPVREEKRQKFTHVEPPTKEALQLKIG